MIIHSDRIPFRIRTIPSFRIHSNSFQDGCQLAWDKTVLTAFNSQILTLPRQTRTMACWLCPFSLRQEGHFPPLPGDHFSSFARGWFLTCQWQTGMCQQHVTAWFEKAGILPAYVSFPFPSNMHVPLCISTTPFLLVLSFQFVFSLGTCGFVVILFCVWRQTGRVGWLAGWNCLYGTACWSVFSVLFFSSYSPLPLTLPSLLCAVLRPACTLHRSRHHARCAWRRHYHEP